MLQRIQSTQQTSEALITDFFRQTAGEWRSERRYYTLKSSEIQEVVSFLTVEFLPSECDELIQLAQLHGLPEGVLVCGALTCWDSRYATPQGKKSRGSCVFGVLGEVLYRDRGFATSKPVTAQYTMRDAKTLCLHTEYGGSVFEEELKLIGTQYRTRQTLICRAGEEQMIGQYLEKRLA
jgi:hypothetical protein